MSLLGGDMALAFAEIFGPQFLDGSLNVSGWSDNDKGEVTRAPAATPVKVQIDRVTLAMRQAEGFTARSVRLIILQRDDTGAQITAPKDDDSVTVGDQTWRLDMIEADPAQSHWEARGAPTKAP